MTAPLVLSRADLEHHPGTGHAPFLVVALCAAWCGTCTEFRPQFEALAAQRPGTRFVWLDVEDDSDVAGDIDVENFPTLAVFRSGTPVHFGVSLPQRGVVERLIDALAAEGVRAVTVPEEVNELVQHLG